MVTGEIVEIENNRSIKDDIIVIVKETMKFALIGIILFIVVGLSMMYLFWQFVKIDIEIAAILADIIVAVLVVVVDAKKMHTTIKIAECNRRIIRKILKM